MFAVDFILNLTGLLLWLIWRSSRTHPPGPNTPATQPASPRLGVSPRFRAWEALLSLTALLVLRAGLYRYLGAAVDWVPKLDVGLIVLPFRSDRFLNVLLFSALSFARAWFVFYFWLATLAFLRSRSGQSDAILNSFRRQLGTISRWPWVIQLVSLWVLTTLCWAITYPLLQGLEIVSPIRWPGALLVQGLLVTAALVFSLKVLLPVLLLVYFLTSYVYLGAGPKWDFVGGCARALLAPLRRLPLQLGKLDLAPLAGVVLVLAVLHVLPSLVLHRLDQAQVSLWPH